MNKRILLSVMTLLVVGGLVAGATNAYFSSLATSSSNTLASGTMTVVLSDNNETQLAAISDSWEGSNLAPGSTIPGVDITVHNTGTIDAHHLDLVVTLSPNTADLADYIFFKKADGDNGLRFGASTNGLESVNIVRYLLADTVEDGDYDLFDGDDGTTSLYGILGGGDGQVSLQELADLGRIRIVRDSNEEGLDASTNAHLYVNATVGTGLTTQGESLDATLGWTLHQDASQL